MKLVNLSRRPFLNTRPVKRLATFLWVFGALLLLINGWLFGSHITGSSKGQGRLEALGRQIDQEQEALDAKIEELRSLNLPTRNARIAELNELIEARTFPWSALFGSLEEVLPIDVYLASVRPTVADKKKKERQRRPNRALTAREARARDRARARGEEPKAEESQQPATKVVAEPPGLVRLDLAAYARNDDAMFELIENFYASPQFEAPELKREGIDEKRVLSFSVSVLYRLPNPEPLPVEEVQTAEQGADSSEAESGEGQTEDGEALAEADGSEGGTVLDPGSEGAVDPVRMPAPEPSMGIGNSLQPDLRPTTAAGQPREIRRAPSRVDDEALPPEEGEAVRSRTPSRRPASRSASGDASRGSSPRVTTGVPLQPTPSAIPAPPSAQPPRAVRPNNRPTSRPPARTTPSSSTTRRPATTRPPTRQDPRPVPTRPTASSSPRLQGAFGPAGGDEPGFWDRLLGIDRPEMPTERLVVTATVRLHEEREG